MPTFQLSSLQRFVYSHYFVSALRLSVGVLLVFVLGYFLTDAMTASVAAFGATYVAFIDRPGSALDRAKEMLGGALLGALGVSLTGAALNQPMALVMVMVAQAFFFSMLVVYGTRGATIGLACMTLAIITMPSGLSPDKVLGYSLISLTGALGYIVFSMASGRLLELREARQCLSVALYGTSQYLAARAHMYAPGIDINKGYRQLIATQTQMIALQQGARNAILGHLSASRVQQSPVRLMLWNVMVDISNMVDLVISTHTDYTLLHQKLGHSKTLALMHDALAQMGVALEQVAMAVSSLKPPSVSHRASDTLQAMQTQLESMRQTPFAQSEPQTLAICVQIHHRLTDMQTILDRMVEQTRLPANAQPLHLSFLEKSLSVLMSSQSFSPKLFVSNLRLDSAAFRYAIRVSLAVAIAMVAGMQLPDSGAHGYWIVLTAIVIMKPAYSLTKKRNTDRLMGTLGGCALTFALLHITTQPDILLAVLAVALVMCFVFLVTSNYVIYSLFVSVTVLLALHALLPDSINLPTERALDTVIGSLIALACSFVLPSWESKSMPSLALTAIQANERLLRATFTAINDRSTDPLDWQTARHDMQIAFSNFAQGFNRMMAEPASHQTHVAEYSDLVIQVHVMAAEIVNTLKQVQSTPDAAQSVAAALEHLADSLAAMDVEPDMKRQAPATSETLPDWAYALNQLQASTQRVMQTYKTVAL